MLEDYKNALKSGQRAYRACVARGQSPYLAVLDDILVNVNIVSQEPLGLVEIPAESIVGTKTSGRHTAFAPNFMPLLEAVTMPLLPKPSGVSWSRTPSLPPSGPTSARPTWKRASRTPFWPTSS